MYQPPIKPIFKFYSFTFCFSFHSAFKKKKVKIPSIQLKTPICPACYGCAGATTTPMAYDILPVIQ